MDIDDTTWFKIYKTQGGHFRIAHIKVRMDEVVAASPATAFMIGWHIDKVRVRAHEHQFMVCKLHRVSPNTTFITERPSIEARRLTRKN